VPFDIVSGELRPDHPPVKMANGPPMESDEFFALQMRQASNVIIAVTTESRAAFSISHQCDGAADITTEKDPDGILRRAQLFKTYRSQWHQAFRQAEAQFGIDLNHARVEPGRIVFSGGKEREDIRVLLDKDGNFDLADFVVTKSRRAWREKPNRLPRNGCGTWESCWLRKS